VVPLLVAAASLALVLQPRLTARARLTADRSNPVAWPLVGAASIYSGYFGAGSGIMLLVVLLVLVDDRLPEANAIKNMLLGVASLASSAVLVLAGPVEWAVVVPLAVGLFAGSTVGPMIARRVPATAVRGAVAALGLALAVTLWLGPS
jgi:uncharacterized membrane protein YfcA